MVEYLPSTWDVSTERGRGERENEPHGLLIHCEAEENYQSL